MFIFPTYAEYCAAEAAAKAKLERIINREGDSDGERHKPYYLNELIREQINLNAFSNATLTGGNSYVF